MNAGQLAALCWKLARYPSRAAVDKTLPAFGLSHMGGQSNAPRPTGRRWFSVKNAGGLLSLSAEKTDTHWEFVLKYCGPKFRSTGRLCNRR
jgi:hypothetical protein